MHEILHFGSAASRAFHASKPKSGLPGIPVKSCPDTSLVGRSLRNSESNPTLSQTARKGWGTRHLVFASSHLHDSRGPGNADVLVHRHYRQLMSTFLQRKGCEQLVVQRLCSLGSIHPKLQSLDPNRRVA